MNIYESVVIFKPNEKIAKEEIKKYTDLLQTYSSEKKVRAEDMGEKRLAYDIKDHKSGWYGVFTFESDPENIADLERQYRIDDDVLKFITMRKDDDEYEFERDLLEDLAPGSPDGNKSEQDQPDAEDVLLGLAQYK